MPTNANECHQTHIECHRTQSNTIEYHGIPWNTNIEHNRIPWNTMEPWNTNIEHNRIPWNTMEYTIEYHGTMEPWNTNINPNILIHAIHYYTYDCKIQTTN